MNNQPFCSVPWDHLYVQANQYFGICCTSETVDKISTNFEEHWNSTQMKQLRLDMINHTPNKDICKNCLGDRVTVNAQYLRRNRVSKNNIQEMLDKTTLDGNTTYIPKSIEIRTDLCNFKCRTCSEIFSSSIRGERVSKNLKIMSDKGNINSIEKIGLTIELLSKLEFISWAGGEPFISPIHWEVMNKLVEIGNTNCKLYYYTNLSFPGNTLDIAIKLLKQFPNVFLYPSLDGTGEDGEYIREGLNYQKFLENLKKLKTHFPTMPILLGFTATSLGMLTIDKVIQLCIDNNMVFEGRKGIFKSNNSLSINCLKSEFFEYYLERARIVVKNTQYEEQVFKYLSFLKDSYYKNKPIIPKDHARKLENIRGKVGYFEKRMQGMINE